LPRLAQARLRRLSRWRGEDDGQASHASDPARFRDRSFVREYGLERNMSKVPMTVEGALRLRAELHRLKTIERPSVIQAIAEARAHGDLSENADYDAAKERQGFIEGRISELEGKLANAQVIDPASIDAEGRVVFGATVDLEDGRSGDTVTYKIVGDDEADIKHGKISVSSPIARALIGKSEGDTADVQAPGGVRSYDILAVRYV
jgi:transcription elongation factor GreA